MFARVRKEHVTIRGDDLRLQQAPRGHSIFFGETAEPATLDQSCDADGCASPALHIATGFGRDRVVGRQPSSTGLNRYGSSWCRSRTTLGHERVMQGDLMHFACPDQQGVGRVRRTLVAVAAAFHHQSQIVFTREVDGSDYVLGAMSSYCICAGRSGPSIEPAGGLCPPCLLSNEIRVLHLRNARGACRAARRVLAG